VAGKRKETVDFGLINAGMRVAGAIATKGSIRVDGTIEGDLSAAGDVALGPGSAVEGNVAGRNVSVAGSVRGNVRAAGKLILEAKAIVYGDVTAQRLVIDDGAVFDGSCVMMGSGEEPAAEGAKQR
jgi:cytoskeletal protein CcmA (bactofilin family)